MSANTTADALTILESLRNRDHDIVRSAAFDAGDLGITDAIPLLSDHIKSRNVGVQEAAEYALRKIRGPKVLEKMIPYLHSDDSSLRNVAMDILREIACDDVPSLCPLLRHQDPDIRIFMSDILGHSKSRLAVGPLCEALLKDPEVNVRYQAAMSLGNLAFPEAAETLHQAMEDEEWVQFSVVEALTKIGADSTINTFVQSLNTCSPLVASIIIDALGELKNIKAVPLLLKFIEKAPDILRHKTVKTIVQILGPDSLCLIAESEQAKFKTYLEQALSDEDDDVKQIALTGLSAMGDASASAAIMDLLEENARASESDIYQGAISALAAIGFNDAFASFLSLENPTRLHIATLACLHMECDQCIPRFKEIFANMDRDSQRLAAKYIAVHASIEDAPFVLNVLQNCADENVIKSAINCLGETLTYEPAQEIIFSFLEHPYTDVKEAALEACIRLHTPTLAEHFMQWLQNGDEEQRMMAVYALGAFGVQENYTAITQALQDENFLVRQLAVEAFAQQSFIMQEHLDTIYTMLKDPAPEVRTSVIDVLGASQNIAVLPYLIHALDDENDWVCIRSIEALTALHVEDLIPILLKKREHATPMVTLKIIEVLTDLGGEDAFKALLELVQSDIAEIQQAATDAIAKIKAG